ncbi:HAMP domain-containing sensor histidine kinase [Virgisporangium aurantiacum]|uniref:histidine kinase n=1 Tax=Virgisporangium aurantiacum TaxID=175570 RepID=A0A8J3ZJY2_9ACTN|nr:ATP-binding protein [Virgisporangium aurantiacum]GIJ64327.1 two-component sensor histidine kinase [Virgisporangium aurantiacum]
MTGRPSIRRRLALIAGAATTVVAVVMGVSAWLALSQTLIRQIDRELNAMTHGPLPQLTAEAAATIPTTPLKADNDLRLQVRFTDGARVTVPRDTAELPWSAADTAVANGVQAEARYTVDTDHGRFRVLTFRGNLGQTIQMARSLAGTDATLRRFGLLTAALIVGAASIAAVAGRLVARAGLRPVDELTTAATRIAETRDLSKPIQVCGHDEIAQLGRAFNHMLGRLDVAQRQQRELIEDAAHELRTPMSSLRTNVELLIHAGDRLAPSDRSALLTDLATQSIELTDLVANLVNLARSNTGDEPAVATDLTELAAEASDLARAHYPRTTFRLDARDALTITARPGAVQRALVNLLDNAAKFGPPGQDVEIHIRDTAIGTASYAEVSVHDRGPTIPADHRDRVFQRFHRLDASRSMPGSGLGLAIVQQTAAQHGGIVTVDARPGGGNTFRLLLPATPVSPTPPGENR